MSGIGETNLRLALQQALTPSAYQGVVGIGSDAQHVVDAVGGFGVNQWQEWAIQFTQDTVTLALRGRWQQIASNTGTTHALVAPLPAVPAPGDTYNIRPFGAQVQDIRSVAGTPQTAADWTPLFQGMAKDGTDATGVAVPAGATGIRGWLSSIYNLLFGGTAKVTANIGTTGGLALDGTDANGVAPPAGATGIRGWLSALYNLLSGGTAKVTVSASNLPDQQALPVKVVSGGATTIADGADVTQGGKGDLAATDSTSAWSVIALLKGLLTKLAGTVTVDTELPVAAALADATANPTVPTVGADLMGYNGSTWDRLRVATKTMNAQGSSASILLLTPTTGKKYNVFRVQGSTGLAAGKVVECRDAGATIIGTAVVNAYGEILMEWPLFGTSGRSGAVNRSLYLVAADGSNIPNVDITTCYVEE